MIIYSYPPQPTVSVSVPPLEFMRDGVNTPVKQDTATPASNKPLPAGLYFYKNGVIVPVTDSATPSEVAAIPVTIKATDGTNITITAGDINIHTTSEGVTFDSQRIGDGSGVYLKVNADGSINAVTGGLTDTQLRASAIAVTGPLTDAQLRATAVPVSASALPLPSGAATEAKQDLAITKLTEMDTAVDAMSLKLPSVIGKNLPADSMSVTLATGEALPLPTGASTAAKQDILAAKLPSTIGQKASADSLSVVFASDSPTQPVEVKTIGGGLVHTQKAVGIVAVRATVSGLAPDATRKKLWIKPSSNNAGRIWIGGSTVTTADGMEIIGPDRLEFDLDSADYYLISDTAAQVVEIMERV